MTLWLWLLVGLLAGALNAASIAVTVGRLRPGEGQSSSVASSVAALSLFTAGFFVRLLLAALVLSAALRQSAAAGLLAFAGMGLGRWTMLFWVNAPAPSRKVKA